MSESTVDVLELAAWGLDNDPLRDSATSFHGDLLIEKIRHAQKKLALRQVYTGCSALLTEETQRLQHLFEITAQREDLHEEYSGLDWTLGIVDLRLLLAFQRRLVFGPEEQAVQVPQQHDWPGLVAFALGSRRDTQYHLTQSRGTTHGVDIRLYSSNPDLHLRVTNQSGCRDSLPLSLHGGCPFFEAAELRGRWFLRDGYHRAYRLLQAGVHRVPAVVLRTRNLEELGVTQPWFFDDDQLFSDRPPHVMDFIDREMILCYQRAALRKVIRIRIEESLKPFDEIREREGEKI